MFSSCLGGTAYLGATLSPLWATLGYGSLLFWATWLFKYCRLKSLVGLGLRVLRIRGLKNSGFGVLGFRI